jgi:hypothetical protein
MIQQACRMSETEPDQGSMYRIGTAACQLEPSGSSKKRAAASRRQVRQWTQLAYADRQEQTGEYAATEKHES